ncbi:MAG: ATP-binding protein [Acidobacteriota bacterium]
MANRIALALLLLGLSAGILGFAVGYGVARRVRRSMVQLGEPLRAAVDALESRKGSGKISAQINFKDLETMLHKVTNKAGEVVEQLRERQHEVIRADQMAAVGQLAAGLAHELRNPLMSIKILVQSAARRGDGSLLDASDLKVLNEEVTRLENLLQEFMDFARPATLQKSEFDLVEVVTHTVGFLKGRAQRRNVSMECRLPDHILVEGDAAQIRQVLLNLLLNALDSVSNGGFIWVDAYCADDAVVNANHGVQGAGYVYLRVSDNGSGLPENERERICEPFFSTKETGLGLGLAISSRIIHGHGGEITATDRDGGGAVFTVKLPLGDDTETVPDTFISTKS